MIIALSAIYIKNTIRIMLIYVADVPIHVGKTNLHSLISFGLNSFFVLSALIASVLARSSVDFFLSRGPAPIRAKAGA